MSRRVYLCPGKYAASVSALYNYFIVLFFLIAFILLQPLAARTAINSCVYIGNVVYKYREEIIEDEVHYLVELYYQDFSMKMLH